MSVRCAVGAICLVSGMLLGAPSAFCESRRSVTADVVIAGEARVIDGDTLDVDGRRVRLEGIDAPEAGQTCGAASPAPAWACGTAATRALRALIARQPVSCIGAGADTYGRVLGRCMAGGVELNRTMVERGHAWAFVKYSGTYVAAEAHARAERIGIWQGPAIPAWEWRHSKWAGQAAFAPQGCAIKGNVSRFGRIYHMPWSRFYGQVRLDTGRGERWFCSEGEAMAAGWRAARS